MSALVVDRVIGELRAAPAALDPRRALVLSEARSWLGTPYHHAARLKGIGADCGQLPLAVYEAARVIPHVPLPGTSPETPHYSADFAQHRDDEWYLGTVERFARRVDAPRPGDFAIWLLGRLFSHGAIVSAWPTMIHACGRARLVLEDTAERAWLTYDRGGRPRTVRFYSPFAD